MHIYLMYAWDDGGTQLRHTIYIVQRLQYSSAIAIVPYYDDIRCT